MKAKTETVENWWDIGINPITGMGVWAGLRRNHTPKNKRVSSFSKHYDDQENNL